MASPAGSERGDATIEPECRTSGRDCWDQLGPPHAPNPPPLCSSPLSLSSFPLDAPHDGGLSTTHGARLCSGYSLLEWALS